MEHSLFVCTRIWYDKPKLSSAESSPSPRVANWNGPFCQSKSRLNENTRYSQKRYFISHLLPVWKSHKSCSKQVSDILSIQTFAPVWASNTMWTSTTLKNAFPMNLFQILFSSITCIFMTISLSLFQFTQLSNSIESQPLTGRWLNSLKSTQTSTKSLFILVIGGIYKFIK